MSYKAHLEKCMTLGKGLVLHDGLFLTTGEVQAYYLSTYLGNYEVEKVVKKLHEFKQEVESIRRARVEDVILGAKLGTIIVHSQSLEEIVKNLAKRYFG
ncbi:MAG: hypothetical protein ACP5O8_03175 [Candidatus Aenigmatarchaeota archaeon]